jgi:esterase/lipase
MDQKSSLGCKSTMTSKSFLLPLQNGKQLNATLYISNENSASKLPMIILCHGLSGEQSEWGRFKITAEAINEVGYDALTFDFSGSGKNPREEIYLSKQVDDLEQVFNWVKSQGYDKIATIGLSFGGTTSLIAELPGRKVSVFWAPGFYYKKAQKGSNIFKVKMLSIFAPNKKLKRKSKDLEPIFVTSRFFKEMFNIDSNLYLKALKIPTLIVQGTKDNTVKSENNYEVIKYLPQDSDHQLIKIEGAGHVFTETQLDEAIRKTIEFLKKYI